jgi:GntR family transcriptional regulator
MICDSELAGFLNMEPGSAALHIERTILDRSGEPLLYENLFYRGDRFRFGMEIARAHLG